MPDVVALFFVVSVRCVRLSSAPHRVKPYALGASSWTCVPVSRVRPSASLLHRTHASVWLAPGNEAMHSCCGGRGCLVCW